MPATVATARPKAGFLDFHENFTARHLGEWGNFSEKYLRETGSTSCPEFFVTHRGSPPS
jgi:hypothetical protein